MVSPLRAMSIKSALRDWLSVSYGMKSILRIGSLRSPPPIRAAPDFPLCRVFMLSCRDMAPLLSTHSPTAPRGEGGGASHQRGNAFPTPAGRLYGFRRQRRYKKWRRRRRTSPAQRYYITPEGGALNPPVRRSRSQAEPWQPRAERPGGWLNPHARKGVSTFGNTGKHRPGPSPDPDRATGAHFHPLNPGHPVAPRRYHNPWAHRAHQTYEPSGPLGRSNLRTFFHNLSTQPTAEPCPFAPNRRGPLTPWPAPGK